MTVGWGALVFYLEPKQVKDKAQFVLLLNGSHDTKTAEYAILRGGQQSCRLPMDCSSNQVELPRVPAYKSKHGSRHISLLKFPKIET